MDRIPRKAPYSVGTKLRYLGQAHSYYLDDEGNQIPIQKHGMEVVVAEVKPGYRGTLRQLDWDELEGEPVLDHTRDGYSVYVLPNGHGRIIWPKDAAEWEQA
jgi:hypothetical protein